MKNVVRQPVSGPYAMSSSPVSFFRTMEIHVDNRVAEVTLISKEGNNIRITVDGKLYEIDLTMQGKGRCSILHDGRSHNAELVRQEGNKSYDVHIDHTAYQVTIIDEQTKFKRSKQTANENRTTGLSLPCRENHSYSCPKERLLTGRRNGHRTGSHEDADQLQSNRRLHRKRYPGKGRRFCKYPSGTDNPGYSSTERIRQHPHTEVMKMKSFAHHYTQLTARMT